MHANARIISARYPDTMRIGYHEQGTSFVLWAVLCDKQEKLDSRCYRVVWMYEVVQWKNSASS